MARDALPRFACPNRAAIRRQVEPMRRLTLEIAAALGLTLAAILALATGARANDIEVTNAFARASATDAAMAGSAYLTLVNHAAAADTLVAVATDAASAATVHQTVADGDVMSMPPVERLEVGAGATVTMQPGGLHIMLMGLKAPLRRGGTIRLRLTFEHGGELAVEVPVAGVAANGPDQPSGG